MSEKIEGAGEDCEIVVPPCFDDLDCDEWLVCKNTLCVPYTEDDVVEDFINDNAISFDEATELREMIEKNQFDYLPKEEKKIISDFVDEEYANAPSHLRGVAKKIIASVEEIAEKRGMELIARETEITEKRLNQFWQGTEGMSWYDDREAINVGKKFFKQLKKENEERYEYETEMDLEDRREYRFEKAQEKARGEMIKRFGVEEYAKMVGAEFTPLRKPLGFTEEKFYNSMLLFCEDKDLREESMNLFVTASAGYYNKGILDEFVEIAGEFERQCNDDNLCRINNQRKHTPQVHLWLDKKGKSWRELEPYHDIGCGNSEIYTVAKTLKTMQERGGKFGKRYGSKYSGKFGKKMKEQFMDIFEEKQYSDDEKLDAFKDFTKEGIWEDVFGLGDL